MATFSPFLVILPWFSPVERVHIAALFRLISLFGSSVFTTSAKLENLKWLIPRIAFSTISPPARRASPPRLTSQARGGSSVRPAKNILPRDIPRCTTSNGGAGRTLPEFQILLITDCAGEFESEATGLVRFEDSALMILFPGIWHRYRPLPEHGWTERWLSFSGELVYRLFDFRLSGPRLALTNPRDVDRMVRDFDDLLHTIHNSPGTDPMLLSLKALRIVVEAATCRLEDAPHLRGGRQRRR